MKNFRRALADASIYWPWLVLAWLCSAGVATLWSANIAAVFPILEVTLRGEAPQKWNERRLADAEAKTEEIQRQIDHLAAQPRALVAAHQIALGDLRMSLQTEKVRAASARKLKPWLERYVPHDPFHVIVAVVCVLLCSMLLKQALQVGASMMVASVSHRIARQLRQKVFDKALGMDRASFLEVGQSGFTSQITHTSDALAGGINAVFGNAVSEPLKLIACLVGAALISWRLLLASMLFAPLGALLILWLNRKLRGTAKQMLGRSVGFHHVLLEALHSMLTVQAYTMEDQERQRFHRATGDLMRYGLRAHFYNTLASPVTETVGVTIICLAILLGAQLTLHQTLSIFGVPLFDQPLGVSALMVFFGMLLGASEPVRRLSAVVTGINTGMVAADILYPLLDKPTLIAEPAVPQTLHKPHRELKLNDVTFGYRADDPILRGVNLTIPFGETVAIVGPNGCGKSTLVGLVCRFFDPQQGSVTLDGISLKQLGVRDLRSRIALVTQHTELFNDSILYNIRYGRWDATPEEVVAAARLAKAHGFIQRLPDKYETRTGPSGLKLSGGQRQRIALARALLRNPEILVLDEATSQVDVESERVIHDVLATFRGARTTLIITHRESALELADRVVRIENGAARILDERVRQAA